MLSDTDLRSQLQRLGFSPGPITAATRATYLKKLQKLQSTNGSLYENEEEYGDGDTENGSNEDDEDALSDDELRTKLVQLGQNPGPITAATRGVYLKKLSRLQDAAVNGHGTQNSIETRRRKASPSRTLPPVRAATLSPGLESAKGGSGAPARRPPASALAAVQEAERRRAACPQPLSDNSGMYEYEAMDESDSSPALPSGYYAALGPSNVRYSTDLSSGLYRPESVSNHSRYQSDSPSNNSRHQSEFASNNPRHESDTGSNDGLYQPETISSNSRHQSESTSNAWRYKPEWTPLKHRFQPRAYGSDSGLSNSAYGAHSGSSVRASPPSSLQQHRSPLRQPDSSLSHTARLPSSAYLSNGNAGTSSPPKPAPPSYKRDSTPPPKAKATPSASLRQRVAAWCRPAMPTPATSASSPSTLDYDTCSDSDGDDSASASVSELSATEQLRQFRARMNPVSRAAEGAARRRYGSEAARSTASHLVPWGILLLAVTFFGVLLFSYLNLGRVNDLEQLPQPDEITEQPADKLVVWPICGTRAASAELGCVQSADLEPAVQLLLAVQPVLQTAAREALCGRREAAPVPLSELAALLPAPAADTMDRLRDLATIIAYNGELGLRVDLSSEERSLEATDVGTPWLCAIAAMLRWLLSWAATIVAVAAGGLVVRAVVWWQLRRRQQHQQRLYHMVERVLDVVRAHSAAAPSDKPFVAIDHVRDQLLSPSQRSERDQVALWRDTVQFIRDRESRVREECVLVAGESHAVWRWLPAAAAGQRSPAAGRRLWLGQAFQTSNGVNSPVHTRTPCLKIRHMFDPSCETGETWVPEVRDALLEKCEGLAVLHMVVDQRNPEGLVYVKYRSDADALAAFKRIQGCWFDGRLVSVKFIRLERYHERYPDAVSATAPLRPSNALRRSLAELEHAELEDD